MGHPNLLIISLPAYLKVVGAECYLKEFAIFKEWIQHFLQLGLDYSPEDPCVLKPSAISVEVCEGFSLVAQGNSGLAESYWVIACSMKIHAAVDPTKNLSFFHEVMQKVMTK